MTIYWFWLTNFCLLQEKLIWKVNRRNITSLNWDLNNHFTELDAISPSISLVIHPGKQYFLYTLIGIFNTFGSDVIRRPLWTVQASSYSNTSTNRLGYSLPLSNWSLESAHSTKYKKYPEYREWVDEKILVNVLDRHFHTFSFMLWSWNLYHQDHNRVEHFQSHLKTCRLCRSTAYFLQRIMA